MRGILDNAFRHHWRAVAAVAREIGAVGIAAITVDGIMPTDTSGKPPRVGVDEELAGIESMTMRGLVSPVHAISVQLPRPQPVHIAVPDFVRTLRQPIFFDLPPAGGIEKAEINGRRVSGEQREVHALAVPGRPERRRRAIIQARHFSRSGTGRPAIQPSSVVQRGGIARPFTGCGWSSSKISRKFFDQSSTLFLSSTSIIARHRSLRSSSGMFRPRAMAVATPCLS